MRGIWPCQVYAVCQAFLPFPWNQHMAGLNVTEQTRSVLMIQKSSSQSLDLLWDGTHFTVCYIYTEICRNMEDVLLI